MNSNEGYNDNLSQLELKRARRNRRNRNIVRWLWISFLGLGMLIFFFLLMIYNGVIGYMPPIEELEDPHDKLASQVYASDGKTELGRYYYGAGNRVYTDYDAVSPYVIDALVATEDVRFEDHSGIDFRALGRTVFKTLLLGDKSSGGASTITQQLAKQLYSTPSSNMFKRAIQKPIEWMIAIKLERFYTKDEIINMYLNRFDFLNNAVGIKTAANVYFGKEPKDLKAEEAAMLIGMLKNPSYYNPLRHSERTLARRNTVIDQMVKADYLTEEEADSLKNLPLGLDYHRVDHKEGDAPYLREEIRRLMTAKKPVRPKRSDYSSTYAYNIAWGNYNTDSVAWDENPLYGWIEKNPKPDGTHYDLYTDGLRIYTSIDLSMQRYAEEAVSSHLGDYLQPAFNAEKRGSRNGPYASDTPNASRLIQNAVKQSDHYRQMKQAGMSETEIEKVFRTPYEMDVFAWVKETKDGVTRTVPGTKTVNMSPYDSVIYMKSILRAGLMSMDPITGYVKAYVGGPDFTHFQYDMVTRGKRQVGSTVKPFLYTIAMEEGDDPCTTYSTAQFSQGGWTPRGGVGHGAITLQQGLTTSNNQISARLVDKYGPRQLANKMRMFGITGFIDATYPLCLGAVDISIGNMVSAYTAFPGMGVRVDPIFVTRIEDNQGNVIFNAVPHRSEVMSENAALKMITIMQSVIDNGTGRALRGSYGLTVPIGGKTGTTNSNSDGWFVGYTPDLVTGVWVGGEERSIHFNNMAYGQGARAALPIFGQYMKKVYSNPKLHYKQNVKFDFPEGFVSCDGVNYSEESYSSGEEEVTEVVEGAFE